MILYIYIYIFCCNITLIVFKAQKLVASCRSWVSFATKFFLFSTGSSIRHISARLQFVVYFSSDFRAFP